MPNHKTEKRKIRYAVAGLGYISQVAVLPAFKNATKNCQLTALVSDDAGKLKKLAKQYGAKHTADYSEYDALLRSGQVDAVYVALPNTMHHEYTVRAANAGVHVLCEKPMATSVSECREMIRACRDNGVKLMIAYRLHLEKANLRAVEIATSGKLGDLRIFDSTFAMQVKPGNIRLKRELGGGTLWDIGIYCVNAARYLFRDEPVRAFAHRVRGDDARFRETEEMVAATLLFPGDRVASFVCSFGAADIATYRLVGTKGSLEVDNAYEYAEEITQRLTVGSRTTERTFPKRDQFAPELIYFSDCVLTGKDPQPSGEEGMADVRVIESLYRSADKEAPVSLGTFDKVERPEPEQEISRPAVRKPALYRAQVPSRH